MYDIAKLPHNTVLVEWATYEGSDHLQRLTDYLNRLGYVFFTKRNPEGRPVTKHDARRILKRALMSHPAYPDRAAIRSDVLAHHYTGELV